MTFSWWIDKENLVYPSNEILFSNKGQTTDMHTVIGVYLKDIVKWKELDAEDCILYDCIYIKCPSKANLQWLRANQ